MPILYSVAGLTRIVANTSWPYGLLAYYPKTTMPAKQSKAHQNAKQKLFDEMCKAHGLPLPDHEVQFHPTRKWRIDYVFEGWCCLEIEGGVWTRGRHTRGSGFIKDMEKYNEAQLMGYVVFRCTTQQVKNGYAFHLIKTALGLYDEMS